VLLFWFGFCDGQAWRRLQAGPALYKHLAAVPAGVKLAGRKMA